MIEYAYFVSFTCESTLTGGPCRGNAEVYCSKKIEAHVQIVEIEKFLAGQRPAFKRFVVGNFVLLREFENAD